MRLVYLLLNRELDMLIVSPIGISSRAGEEPMFGSFIAGRLGAVVSVLSRMAFGGLILN
jgi:hypothetical protein